MVKSQEGETVKGIVIVEDTGNRNLSGRRKSYRRPFYIVFENSTEGSCK